MSRFTKYRRTQIAEMRQVTKEDMMAYQKYKEISANGEFIVSIAQVDVKNGSPKIGDMIARNPQNHSDQWLIAEKYFKENFEKL